jgi:hypothetical protein
VHGEKRRNYEDREVLISLDPFRGRNKERAWPARSFHFEGQTSDPFPLPVSNGNALATSRAELHLQLPLEMGPPEMSQAGAR